MTVFLQKGFTARTNQINKRLCFSHYFLVVVDIFNLSFVRPYSAALPILICAILIMARVSMNNVYLTVLFFSFFFRHFLVLYADRGLVRNGQTNLELFNQLYWLAVLSFSALLFGVFFIPNIWRGEYIFQNMNRARACLLGEMPQFSSEKQTIKKAVGTTLVTLLFCRLIQSKRQVTNFMKKFCPNNRVSCIGKFRRNVIDIKDTFLWLLMWCLASFICCLSVDYGRNVLSVEAQFWIWNMTEFVCYEGLHFVLPFLLNLPTQGREQSAQVEFYVRKPSFEPARHKITKNTDSIGYGKGKRKNKVGKFQYILPSETRIVGSQTYHVCQFQSTPGRSHIQN